ncbi:MAG: hypothetical protein Satyrvirus3_7 [Satyrvirus sp.]|uniref:Uncharacterized protein n=1 Tax=Satyrvirus sp. TaxID=2487771 RepID=A0A3G5ACZ4_9VIRU|nr:MAG: hypothetical protein Satyrvirus3_7 [Satyrvirus sp.]
MGNSLEFYEKNNRNLCVNNGLFPTPLKKDHNEMERIGIGLRPIAIANQKLVFNFNSKDVPYNEVQWRYSSDYPLSFIILPPDFKLEIDNNDHKSYYIVDNYGNRLYKAYIKIGGNDNFVSYYKVVPTSSADMK